MINRLVTLVLILSIVTGCTTDNSDTTTDSSVENIVYYKIAYINKSSTSPFWVTLQNECQLAAETNNIQLITMGPPIEDDVDGQIDVINTVLDMNIDGIIIAPCDSKAVVPILEKALDMGIPVMSVDTRIDSDKILSHVGTDNYNVGAMAAKWMFESLNYEGNVVLLNGLQSQSAGYERRQGFVDYLEGTDNNVNIVFEKDCEWRDEIAGEAMNEALMTGEKIDAVFAAWDGAGLMAHKILEDNGLLDTTLICGVDAYPRALALIGDGSYEADIAQNPQSMGTRSIETMLDILVGNEVPIFIDTGAELITMDNIDTFINP